MKKPLVNLIAVMLLGTVSGSVMAYEQNFKQLYLRGTSNGWGKTEMALIADHRWQTEAEFGDSSNERFKLDVYGDWSYNIGDNNANGWAKRSEGDISISEGEGNYRILFNDADFSYSIEKIPSGNLAPQADAGNDITINLGESANFNATGSSDPDGEIVSYSWSNGLMAATGSWQYAELGLYTVTLTVTDNEGASASDTVKVTVQDPDAYQSHFEQLFLRGSNNGWGKAAMVLVNNHSWQLDVEFAGTASERFKFDRDGNWSYNFGDDNRDGVAQRSEENIAILQGAGNYRITFNDDTYRYSVVKQGGVFTPYIGPYLTLINPALPGENHTATVLDPATSMVINYELSASNSQFVAQAYYRKSGDEEWIAQAEDKVVVIGDDFGIVHHITLTNLQPDTLYEYKVSGPGEQQFSAQYDFKTVKTSMDYSHFLVVGDMQDEMSGQRWSDIVQAIVDDHMLEFDFIVTVGDMASNDVINDFDQWKLFFNKGQNLFAHKAMLPTMGNHDTPANPELSSSQNCGANSNDSFKIYCSNAEDTRSFRKYFYIDPDMSFPDYYSYRFGNACFISVNSEIPVFYGRYMARDIDGKKQRQDRWLEAEIAQAQRCDWSFAYWHVPAIDPAGAKDEVQYMRPYVEQFNHKLDWALSGHVHQYQRIKPMTATAYTTNINQVGYGRGHDHGVGYLLSAPAGQEPRNKLYGDESWLEFYPHFGSGADSKFAYEIGFTIINVDANRFELKTYGLGVTDKIEQIFGYKHQNKEKVLLDVVSYTKPDLSVYAGDDIRIQAGQVASFNAADVQSLSGSIVSYAWSNGLSGSMAEKVYNTAGTYTVELTVSDDKGQTASDSVDVIVAPFQHSFSSVDFRGTPNGWGQTAMALVGDNTWTIEVLVSDSASARFKFYQAGPAKWYGDGADGKTVPDGKAYSSESANIFFYQGAGTYRITFNDLHRNYRVEKQ